MVLVTFECKLFHIHTYMKLEIQQLNIHQYKTHTNLSAQSKDMPNSIEFKPKPRFITHSIQVRPLGNITFFTCFGPIEQ